MELKPHRTITGNSVVGVCVFIPMQAELRRARIRERDVAAKRVLAHSSKTLMDALGLEDDASDADVASTIRKLLRLLHPDYPINRACAGTKRYLRIEAAFKRLNGLRDEA